MLAHLTHRTFVMPDHLSTELGHLEGKSSVSDFFCFGSVGRWVPVISMQQYLDDRCVASFQWHCFVYRGTHAMLGGEGPACEYEHQTCQQGASIWRPIDSAADLGTAVMAGSCTHLPVVVVSAGGLTSSICENVHTQGHRSRQRREGKQHRAPELPAERQHRWRRGASPLGLGHERARRARH